MPDAGTASPILGPLIHEALLLNRQGKPVVNRQVDLYLRNAYVLAPRTTDNLGFVHASDACQVDEIYHFYRTSARARDASGHEGPVFREDDPRDSHSDSEPWIWPASEEEDAKWRAGYDPYR